jgi:glc operon protein GlcG
VTSQRAAYAVRECARAACPDAQLGWRPRRVVSWWHALRSLGALKHAVDTGIGGAEDTMNCCTRAAVAALLVTGLGAPLHAGDQITLDRKVLSLAAARTIVAAAEKEATARGVGVVVVVVDDGGHVIALARMDTAQVASVNVGIGKARTAAIYRRPSRDFEEQIRNGRVAALALADATPLQGGLPVLIDGRVVGAVGVSGDTPQVDEDIALAGVRAIAPHSR